LAAAQVAFGLWALVRFPAVLVESQGRYPGWIFLVQVAAFGTVGLFLYLAGRDRRAELLGLIFLIIAAAYSGRPLMRLASEGAGVDAVAAGVLVAVQLLVFTPALGWELAGILPKLRGREPGERLRRAMWRISLVAGSTLFLLHFSQHSIVRARIEDGAAGSLIVRAAELGFDNVGIALLIAPLFPFQLYRARYAPAPERQRVLLLYTALALGFVPVNILILFEVLSPRSAAFMSRPLPSLIAGLIVFPALALIPFTTGYLVLVHRVVETKVLLRRTLQYGLARSTIFAASLLPLMALALFAYLRRDLPLSRVVAGPEFGLLLVLFAVAVVAARARHRILSFLDRRFFREQYDSQEILTRLVEAARWVASSKDLATLVTTDVDRALHLQKVDLLLSARASRSLQSPLTGDVLEPSLSADPAQLSSGVVELAPRGPSSEAPLSAAGELGLTGKGWALLAPLSGSEGSLLGLLLIGEKKSELGFSAADRALLGAVAASAAMALENLWARSYAGSRADEITAELPSRESDPALECPDCGRIFSPEVEVCLLCDAKLATARVPILLSGKFAIQRRIGRGGMGVVYLATDLDLERQVAVKALPDLQPDRTRRLLAEARAMAAVTHPSLATIHGAETWRGNPLLILEYLAGGDLRLRLRAGPLDADRALAVALAIARALRRIHGAGLLHHDIKPSNVGLTEHGEPKLLDFGLARMLGEEIKAAAPTEWDAAGSAALTAEAVAATALTLVGKIVGTPAYLPPEALSGAPSTPAFDLWGLSMVLFESLVGRNPFMASSRHGTLVNVLHLDLRPILEQSLLPQPVKELLQRSLARDPAARPRSAAELEDLLAAARRGARHARGAPIED
jgi:hypothetical protein